MTCRVSPLTVILSFALVTFHLHSQEKRAPSLRDESYSLTRKGREAEKINDWKGAIRYFTQALKLVPDDYSIYGARGISKRKLGDVRGAIDDHTIAITLLEEALSGKRKLSSDPFPREETLGQYYWHRGIARLDLGDKDGGCRDFSKAGQLGYDRAYDYIREDCQ